MTFRRNVLFGSILAAAACWGTAASAQATRTWVSGVGDDVNPCSRTAPCKTFAGAISKTATGGEINCLDPGGFGGVTITKALSIICNYTEGGVLSAGAGVNGVVVNAPAASHVYLRGLDFHGAQSAQNGIRFIAGASLTVEDTVIRSYNATNGLGISFQPSGTSRMFLNNVTVNNNGTAATGGGILVQPTGAAGNGRVVMNNVRVQSNENIGLRVDATGNTGPGTIVLISNSSFNGSTTGIQVTANAGTSNMAVSVIDSIVSNNGSNGIATTGTLANVQVGGSTVSGNTNGIVPGVGSTLASWGDNRFILNGSDGVFTGLVIQKK